jgi:hypothetical protein
MIQTISYILLLFLFFISIIDWKVKKIPSIVLTGMIFLMIIVTSNIYYGLIAFVMAWLLYEGDFVGGIADVKVITIIGFILTSFFQFSLFIMLIFIYGLVWKILIKWKFRKWKETPFLPVLFFVYLTLFILTYLGAI